MIQVLYRAYKSESRYIVEVIWVVEPQKVMIKERELRWKEVCRDSSALAEIMERCGFEALEWRTQRSQKSGLHCNIRNYMDRNFGNKASTQDVKDCKEQLFMEAKKIANS